ncbi:ATP-binding protein [Paenibacillus sp. MMS20-IR301]|uniref:two-component system sensor histidine kinase NtrB n=1 Tax=Paenibacillus sp. MMS20-IR301 TaxID=2895946 RepID=UPI0028EF38F2|nr:ATP-binding protein [Paenibacillus sp. MMS20-IR301]WNS40729.1 ATP-binding protein [Paenibacillus sp. MMS20-IR301]
MAYHEQTLRSSLNMSISTILERHYQSMLLQNTEFAWFVEMHKELLDLTFSRALKYIVEALFLSPDEYNQSLIMQEQEGFEQGSYTAEIFGDHFDSMLEMSKDLNLTAQNVMFGIIEQLVDESEQRLFFYNRLMECNWTRFSGFARGYSCNKNQQIDSLHEQKIAVMGQMAAGMAHEIRNPLASIKGFAQLIHHRLYEPEVKTDELRAYLDITIKEIDTLNGLVTDFLMLSRKGDGMHNSGAVFNIIEVIHRVNNIVNQLILSGDITLVVDYSQESILTFGSASQLEQVFLNILKNSIDSFTACRGTIVIAITTLADTNEVLLVFSDNGEGIPQDKLTRIFDPFFTTKPKGTGIGLSICKQLIEASGGQIAVDSVVSAGTSVSVKLPWVSGVEMGQCI